MRGRELTQPRRGFEFRYPCILWKEDGEWTAHNPDIGAFGVGPTRKAAIIDFTKAARLMTP